MKIQCDMCEKMEASVYCTADEASLCHGCDRRVHHANKLASKHHRFSLNNSSDQPPFCDICQEKRAFLFCKEDRAILCRQCDISIHVSNEHTKYHNRFLLAGVKLSASSSCYDSSSDQALCSSNSIGSSEAESIKSSFAPGKQKAKAPKHSSSVNNHCDQFNQQINVSMEPSSISDYLMETLPEWNVEELLDPSVSHPYNEFYEGYDSGTCTLPFMAHDTDNIADLSTLWLQDLGSLVNLSDQQKSRSSSFSKRCFFNDMENIEKLNKDQYKFNPSSIKKQRQLW
ncbi:B-box zinc finger protein 20-like [Rutidosis leptorrhynchoides]|uniref:B-box zinc finger protein 20-like n=1 Tax=Rutidosis leptorrhynchoides TaxID=125765 RepID=UPI003A996EE5